MLERNAGLVARRPIENAAGAEDRDLRRHTITSAACCPTMVPKFDSVMVGLRRSAGVRLRSRTAALKASIWRRQSAGARLCDIAQHRHKQTIRTVDCETEINPTHCRRAKAPPHESLH